MMHGAACLAFRNISRTPFSDSPTHFDNSSGPFTEIKLDSVIFASAFAIRVFPVPGGPCSKIPFGVATSTYWNASLCFSGHSTASLSSSLSESSPPTSSHVTFGICTSTSRNAEGLTSFRASLKSSSLILIFCKISAEIFSCCKSMSGRILRNERIAASLASDSRSAPTNP